MKTILWFSIVIATGVYICGPIVDPDLWWHITVGRLIIGHGEIPSSEHWNRFALGDPWIAYSWAPEIIFAFIDTYFGDRGLIALKLLLSIVLAFSFFYGFARISKDYFFGGLLGMYVTAACYNHFTLRPQSLVWIYFIALMVIADRIAREGFTAKGGLLLALVMSAWANTHLTTVIGIMAVGAWLLSWDRIADTARSVGSAFAGTLLTPYYGTEWLTFFSKSDHPLQFSIIAEFSPATVLQYSTAFVIVLLTLLFLLVHLRPRFLTLSRAALGGILLFGGLAVVKFLPFSVMGIAILLASMWREGIESGESQPFGNFSEAIDKFRTFYNKIPEEGLAFVFFCTVFNNGISVWRYPVALSVIPVDAVDLIQGEKLPHPIMNPFGQGGYLMYRFSNENGELEHKVAIDGRTNVNPPHVWAKYHQALLGKEDWHKWLDLVDPRTILWKNESAFTSLLSLHPEWCRIYMQGTADQGYTIYLRRDEVLRRKSSLIDVNCSTSDVIPFIEKPINMEPEE